MTGPAPLRRPRVVLWGGRPLIDYQFGSGADRMRAQRLRTMANMRRVGASLLPAMKLAAKGIADFQENMRKAGAAIAALEDRR